MANSATNRKFRRYVSRRKRTETDPKPATRRRLITSSLILPVLISVVVIAATNSTRSRRSQALQNDSTVPHSFEIVNTFPHDTHAFCQGLDFDGEGWELTHDGNHLIMSDGSDTLRCLAAC